MNLQELQLIINALVETHGGDMRANFKYRFGSGRTAHGPVTSYQVSPPKQGYGSVTFTIDYARGEPTNV
jgi:hypothetical protein